MASTILAFLIGLLAMIGIDVVPSTTPPAASGSILVIARACPAGVNAAGASAAVCAIWLDGAAMQVTDLKGNAWGMNASRDDGIAGAPVIYRLDGMAFGTYTLGQPSLPQGFAGAFIDGAELTADGKPHIELSPSLPRIEITVYFLR